MYIPEAFREDRPEALRALIEEHSFGTLVSRCEGEFFASHLPLLLDPDRGPHGTLLGHMARANPQWQGFREGEEVLAIFQGPHAYVSPSWYETELSVPTWNYAVVHACGVPRLMEAGPALRDLLERTVSTYEAGRPDPWTIDHLPAPFVEKLMEAIVGFEIPIARLEGKLKLGQNRSEADRAGAAAGLRAAGTPLGLAVAELMDAGVST